MSESSKKPASDEHGYRDCKLKAHILNRPGYFRILCEIMISFFTKIFGFSGSSPFSR